MIINKKLWIFKKRCVIACVFFNKIHFRVGSKAPLFCYKEIRFMRNRHPLQDLLEPKINELGFDVVRIITIGQANPTLQIMIERKDRTDIIVSDCAKVSRAISEILDEKDPIKDQYSLEVSSPGLDRPLVTLEHFQRYVGSEVKLETSVEVQKRKRFNGKIASVDDQNNIHFIMDDVEYVIAYDDIAKAKIVITDEMLKAYEQDLPVELFEEGSEEE